METSFTQSLGIQWPIVQAGMGSQAGSDLAAAVSEAGALGTIGTIATPPGHVREEVERLRTLTAKPFSLNLVAFPEAPFSAELVDLALELRPPSVTLSFGNTPALVRRFAAANIPAIVQVQNASQARDVIAAGPAAIIAQGAEAGGHTGSRGLFSFLCEVLDMAGDIPVLAAGGIADGRGLAGALAMGAAGAVMGTRFKVSQEFAGPGSDKEAVVAATGDGTVRDPIVDIPFPFAWPTDNTGRLLANDFTREWLGRADELRDRVAQEEPWAFYGEISADPRRNLNWAGESSGLVREILPAAEIVRRTVAEAEEALRRLAGLLQPVS